eukprot:3929496-Prymnesium_polylepis.1
MGANSSCCARKSQDEAVLVAEPSSSAVELDKVKKGKVTDERISKAVDQALREIAPSFAQLVADHIASPGSRLASPSVAPATNARSQKLASTQAKWEVKGAYAAFLSHFKREAATEARLCQYELEKLLGVPGKVFIDSDNLKDLRKLQDHVRESDVLVLLLTENFLTRPWCLLEIYTAITHGIPIVALNVQGGHPYDYDQAARFLDTLDTSLEQVNRGAMQLLIEHRIEPESAAFTLSTVLPKIISSRLDTGASRNVLTAQLLDLCDTMRVATPIPVDSTPLQDSLTY